MDYCTILGTNINVTDMNEAVQYLTGALNDLRGNYVCVSNVHTTVMAFRDEKYRIVQNSGALALPDGKPLAIVSRKRGFKQAGRVPGPDLMPRIFEVSRESGYRHFFYGSTPETLQLLESRLHTRYPYLQIAGMYSPPFRPLTEDEDEAIVKMINDAKPDYIWVALGAPKQEIWMYEHKNRVNGLMLGVGAAFDFEAGTVRRAPKWMQEMCLEWLYRIMQDPIRLLPRYISTNLSFLWNVYKEGRKLKKENKPLRIAMIGHKRIPSREGGIEIVVDEISTRMVQLGCQVDAYNRYGRHTAGKKFDQNRGKYYNGIRLITIPTPKNSSMNAVVYSFLATVRALFGRYDIIHFHAEGPCMMIRIAKLFRKHVVATIHGLDWQRSKWGNFASDMIKFGEKTAVKYADEIIVLSRNVQDYFRKVYGRETLFIPNGINYPELRNADMICERYGLKKDGYILFLARIVPEKGLHYLIEAFRQINTEKKLVIAGGSSNSNEYVQRIHEMASKDDRIIFTDFVHGQCLEELYSNAYVFVLPSDVEGMSISLLEAMSYGNCCLVSDIPENAEVIEDKAVVFKHGNVQHLADRLTFLLDHPEEVARYQKETTEFICQKYNWDKVVEQTIAIYKEIIGNKH